MKYRFCPICVRLAATLTPLLLACCAPADSITELEDGVRKWVALRREISELKTDWKEKQLLLKDEIRLLEQQKRVLEEKLAARETANREGAAEADAAAARRDKQAAMLGRLFDPLIRAEADLRTWPERLPDFLAAPLLPAFRKVPDAGAAPTPLDLGERLQRVFGLYSQLEQLNHGVHVGKVVLTVPGGKEQEMDGLFLGLAVGYAVSATGDTAAVGRPSADGWQWEWDATLAPEIAKAVACYRKDVPAEFVTLPLAHKTGEK